MRSNKDNKATSQKETTMDKLVQLDSGERLHAGEQSEAGVMTDAGIIGWDCVQGFWSFHKATKRWMFIPIN